MAAAAVAEARVRARRVVVCGRKAGGARAIPRGGLSTLIVKAERRRDEVAVINAVRVEDHPALERARPSVEVDEERCRPLCGAVGGGQRQPGRPPLRGQALEVGDATRDNGGPRGWERVGAAAGRHCGILFGLRSGVQWCLVDGRRVTADGVLDARRWPTATRCLQHIHRPPPHTRQAYDAHTYTLSHYVLVQTLF